jgi:hypothetical protein
LPVNLANLPPQSRSRPHQDVPICLSSNEPPDPHARVKIDSRMIGVMIVHLGLF